MNSTGFFTSFEVEYEADAEAPEMEICLSGAERGGTPLMDGTLTAFMSVDTLDHLYIQISRLLDEINALPKPEPVEDDGDVTSLRRRIYRDIKDRKTIEAREEVS